MNNYYFPNFDSNTRLYMLTELESDIKNNLFYKPLSLNEYGLRKYLSLLNECFKNGSIHTLKENLTANLFRKTNKNGNTVQTNIAEMLAFNDFNRYYIRSILVQAIEHNKPILVYRAKNSNNERFESKNLLGKILSNNYEKQCLLNIYRNYKLLFSKENKTGLLLPNSGLSIQLLWALDNPHNIEHYWLLGKKEL